MARVHSSLLGWGRVFGLTPLRPTPMALLSLPPPPQQHHQQGSSAGATARGGGGRHRFVDVACGSKHLCLVTDTGDVVLMGANRYGQAGRPLEESGGVPLSPTGGTGGIEDGSSGHSTRQTKWAAGSHSGGSSSSSSSNNSSSGIGTGSPTSQVHEGIPASDRLPIYYQLGTFGGAEAADEKRDDTGGHSNAKTTNSLTSSSGSDAHGVRLSRVACGGTHSIVYAPGTTFGVGIGNNFAGQLGAGHKQPCTNAEGFAEWDPSVPYITDPQDRRAALAHGIVDVVCGMNHTILRFGGGVGGGGGSSGGALYSCGTNLYGELGAGDMLPSACPQRMAGIDAIQQRSPIQHIACGTFFTLVLTEEGRVFGCGSDLHHVLARPTHVLEAQPLLREMCQVPPHTTTIIPAASTAAPNGDKGPTAAHTNRDPSRAPSPTQTPSSVKMMRVRRIAAMAEMAVFVTTRNEVIVRGSLESVGFSTGMRARFVRPLEDDEGRHGDSTGLQHPPIADIVAREQNAYIRYEDGRVVGLGANNDGQVEVRALEGVARDTRHHDGGQGGQQRMVVNLAEGTCIDRVRLILPGPLAATEAEAKETEEETPAVASNAIGNAAPPLSAPDRLRMAVGCGFGIALDTNSACLYEVALVSTYRADRDRRRARGEPVEAVLLEELAFPSAAGAATPRSAEGDDFPFAASPLHDEGVGGPATADTSAAADTAPPKPQSTGLEELLKKRRRKLIF